MADRITATYEMGKVAHVNAATGAVGVITRLGQRRLVDDRSGFKVGDEVVVVERAGSPAFLSSLSDWYELGTLEFYGKVTSNVEEEA
jgi:hypothetical protein